MFFCCSIYIETPFTRSGGLARSSGVGFFCFHALGDTKQKKPTPLDRGPLLHVNRPWDSPKLPWGELRICGPFCFEDYHYAFQETLCPVTLAHYIFVFYLSLYSYTSDTFRPFLALLTHFTLHQFFPMYITTRNIFLIPNDTFAWNFIIIFNFSSQKSHWNYIFLSNVYSFDTVEFSMKHKC